MVIATSEPTSVLWFLDEANAELLWQWRFERIELEGAAAALTRVFSDMTSRDAHVDPDAAPDETEEADDGPIWPPKSGEVLDDQESRLVRSRQAMELRLAMLRQPIWGWHDMVGLGVDLATVRPWESAPDIVRRLRAPAQFDGAALEVDVMANAMRAGLRVARVPESKKQKRPDLRVAVSSGEVLVEVKDLSTGEDEMVAWRLWESDGLLINTPAFHDPLPRSRMLKIVARDDIRALACSPAGRLALQARIPSVAEAFTRKIDALARVGWPVGRHYVSGAGYVLVQHREPRGPEMSLHLFDRRADIYHGLRVVPSVSDAAMKFAAYSSGQPGIVFVDIPMNYNPNVMHEELHRAVAADPASYAALDGIVLRRRADRITPVPAQEHEALAIRTAWGRLGKDDLGHLAAVLAPNPHRLIRAVRRRGEPDPLERATICVYAPPPIGG